MSDSPVLLETTKWSELPGVIEQYLKMVDQSADDSVRMFGYASLINDHETEKAGSELPNAQAILHGMEVDMNLYAVGPNEFRGTNDRSAGVVNTGLYAGLGPASSDDGYTDGVNITVDRDRAVQALKAYIKREVGDIPKELAGKVDLDDLFDPSKAGTFKELEGKEANNMQLYTFQVVETEENGHKMPAVTVSTNPKSKFAAIGLSAEDAAMYIIDGQGSRGSALEYFDNFLKSQRGLGVESPRLEAISKEVDTLLATYKTLDDDSSKRHWVNTLNERTAGKGRVIEGKDGMEYTSFPLSQRIFKDGEQLAQRDSDSSYKEALPKTGGQKISHAAAIAEQRNHSGDIEVG